MHWRLHLKKCVSPSKMCDWLKNTDPSQKKTKIKMVHTNIFYRMDLEICDPKSEFWTKTENLRFRKNQNFSFGVQNRLLKICIKRGTLLMLFEVVSNFRSPNRIVYLPTEGGLLDNKSEQASKQQQQQKRVFADLRSGPSVGFCSSYIWPKIGHIWPKIGQKMP